MQQTHKCTCANLSEAFLIVSLLWSGHKSLKYNTKSNYSVFTIGMSVTAKKGQIHFNLGGQYLESQQKLTTDF